MRDFRASDADRIDVKVGETIALESLRQAVVPPYVMIVPFIEPSDGLEVLGQDGLGEDGIHGCVYRLRASQAGEGSLRVGFRDLRTQAIVKERTIEVRVR
jgi:hypothetical protein